jgi:sugar lactone lactonase YvrE
MEQNLNNLNSHWTCISNRRRGCASLGSNPLNILALSILCTTGLASTISAAERGEIVFTDSQAAVLHASALTGDQGIITSKNKLVQPFGIAVGQGGELFVSDTGCLGLVRIDPATQSQTVVACGGALGVPFGIAIERSGMLLVANAQALLRVDSETGKSAVVSAPGLSQSSFRYPLAVTVADNGDIFVADALGPIFHVDPNTGAQTLITSGGLLERPQGIAVKGHNLYVTDVATPDMNFGVGRIIRIDLNTGQQTELSKGANLMGPVGIVIEPDGDLIVGDPYTINPDRHEADGSPALDGAIIRIDKNTGAQHVIARGSENFVNPRGVALLADQGN